MAVPLSLIDLVCSRDVSLNPLDRLGPAHALTPRSLRMLKRFFGLKSVATATDAHPSMFDEPLGRLVRGRDLPRSGGLLLAVKTQTHNTLPDAWLRQLADRHGLTGWETATLSMNHCATGVAALHYLRLMAWSGPAILIAGEKAFHSSGANQSSAVLGEWPVAVLIGEGEGWRLTHSRVLHAPAFNANPDQMPPELRRDFEQTFGQRFEDFTRQAIRDFDHHGHEDLILPYNLNQPQLTRMGERLGIAGRIVTEHIAEIGHLFCADVFYNLSRIEKRSGPRAVLLLAAGMGASFAATRLVRGHSEPQISPVS